MAKRNIRAKAKSAVGAAKQKTQEVQAQLKKSARQEQLLHKTLSPKNTTTKKEKSAQKHTKLLKRFVETKKEAKQDNARKQREKTKVIGDLNPLRDALPSLGDIYKLVKTRSQTEGEEAALAPPEKLSANKKIKKKRAEILNKVKNFEKLIHSKKFKENPREVIRKIVRSKYQPMEEDNEK